VDTRGLLENVTNFVSSTMLLYCECRSSSMMDDLSITCREVAVNVTNVTSKVDSNAPQQDITSGLYVLQDSVNKLRTLIDSKCIDVDQKDQNMGNELTTIMLTCDEISPKLNNTPPGEIKEECTKINDLLNQIKTMRPNFEQVIKCQLDVENILGSTSQHINQVISENELDPNQNMQIMIQIISDICLAINSLANVLDQPHKQPSVWLTECGAIIEGIDKVIGRLNGASTNNSLLNDSLKSYGKTLARLLTQFKFLCCVYGFGIGVSSYENISFALLLKDFAYLLTPIVNKLKEDGLSIYEII